MQTRRAFVRGAALAGGAGLLGLGPRAAAADPPLETRRLRLNLAPSLSGAARPTIACGSSAAGACRWFPAGRHGLRAPRT